MDFQFNNGADIDELDAYAEIEEINASVALAEYEARFTRLAAQERFNEE